MLSMEKFDYTGAEDLEYFVGQLRALNLDVVCLQESHVNEVDSLARRLGAILSMPFVAETPGCPSHIDTNYRLTIAIISKLPFMSQSAHLLPYPTFELKFAHSNKVASAYDRYLQVVTFQDFEIANIHTEPLRAFGLTYESGVGSQLSTNVDDLLVDKLSHPLVFAADFNISLPSKTLPKCIGSFKLEEALPNGPTQPDGWNPDHVLYSQEWQLLDAGIVSTQSDHFLCWSELQLKG